MNAHFPPPEPTTAFPYRILAKVGEGGMGEVYRAEDLALDRQVAIKVIRPEHLARPHGPGPGIVVERFLQEARAAAALSHPGVTSVYRIGTVDGVPYLAMEWLPGRTLEELLAEEPHRFSLAQAVRIAIQVLDVLEVAHTAGIVHRDIKPANLMLLAGGRVKVTDFGIARVEGSRLTRTEPGLIIGTPHYAAPEQLAGDDVDGRVDLYAVGGVLYQLVVGAPAFELDSLYELLRAVHEVAPEPPSARVPGLPPALDAVLATALAKRASDRFASAHAMRAALQPFAGGASPPRPAAIAPTPAAPLRDLALDVIRARPDPTSSVRSDTRAAARALTLQPRAATAANLTHHTGHADARWTLTELAPQFARFGRAAHWKGLLGSLARVDEVRLHHPVVAADGRTVTFDVATYAGGALQHVLERVERGTASAVADFLDRVRTIKHARGGGALGGAILIAAGFDDPALEAYLAALRAGRRQSLLGSLDALSHREGYLRLGARTGLHVLLVEDGEGERRPLVFE